MQAPASEIQDKMSFIINNISAANIEAKAKEFTEILKEEYYTWFAEYMVMKRLETIWFALVFICFHFIEKHTRNRYPLVMLILTAAFSFLLYLLAFANSHT